MASSLARRLRAIPTGAEIRLSMVGSTRRAQAMSLEAQGYRVIRLWNNDVLSSTEGVLLGFL